jgi:hypothetical protein
MTPGLGEKRTICGGKMKRLGKRGILFVAGCLLGITLGQVFTGFSQDSGSRHPLPQGVYVDLTSDFYRALREEGSGNSKTYSNDMSLTYLKEISISTRFMVETNLQVLKNQERIIQMLESRRK